jgi:hypothetical protein
MANAEYLTNYQVDRSGWPDGPWMQEPDRLQWRTSAGLPGLVVRNWKGVWCGYAAVTHEHLCYGRHYDEPDISVHGGLTYSDRCMEEGPVCHIPEPGESDDVWWLGFDCGHGYDFVPRYSAEYSSTSLVYGGDYRDLAYVQAEVESLARQLQSLGG